MNAPREDILIAGGIGSPGCGRSIEIFSCEKNEWFEVSTMNENHYGGASFVLKVSLLLAEVRQHQQRH